MIKKLYALVFTLLLAGCSTGTVEYIPPVEPTIPIHQEDENMAENIALNHATGSYSGFTPNFGVVARMYDDDESTNFGFGENNSEGEASVSGYVTLTLDAEYFIHQVELFGIIVADGLNSSHIDWSIAYWNGAAYVDVYTTQDALGKSWPQTASTININVGRITERIRLSFSLVASKGVVQMTVNEFRLFRLSSGQVDSGLRIKTPQGSGGAMLLKDTTGLSPLKIRKGGETVSLLLVPPSDAAASPLRVRHNGVTYAVAKL